MLLVNIIVCSFKIVWGISKRKRHLRAKHSHREYPMSLKKLYGHLGALTRMSRWETCPTSMQNRFFSHPGADTRHVTGTDKS